MQTGVTGASKEIFVVDFDRTSVTAANKEIFVVDFDTLFTIGSEIFISRVLPIWQGHRVDAQFTHDYKIDSFSTEEVPHQDTPSVQPPPQKRTVAALSKELLKMPVGQQSVGLLVLLRATVPSGQLRLVHPLGVD